MDGPKLRPEQLAGALAALASASGIEAWKRPVGNMAQVEAAFETTLDRLGLVDPAARNMARDVLFELADPYVSIAAKLVATIVEWTKGEMTAERILEELEQNLTGEA